MGWPRGWASAATGRPAMRSPGRPPVARREHRQRFWEAIAEGLSSEDAGVAAGVSPAVGTRWFRESGGMAPVTRQPLPGRYLSFEEREEIALLRAQDYGVREIARGGASLWLALAGAATMDPELGRYHAEWVADITLQHRRLLAVCRDRGWLRDDIPFDDLVETTAVLTSPETYQRIVHHYGLSADAYQKWLRRMLNETVSKR